MLRLAPAAGFFLASSAFLAVAWFRDPPAIHVSSDSVRKAAAYQESCGRCHPTFDPSTHRKSDWRGVVQAMHQRMGDREIEVAPETLELAIEYLEQHGR